MAPPFSFSSTSSPLQRQLLFLPLVICLQFYTTPPIMAQIFPHAVCSTTSGNFTPNSTYQTTLTSLFSSVNSLSYGFFNGSLVTQSKETVSAMGFCRGDVPSAACRNCLQTSASDVRQLCPNQKEAVVWNENCTFRYSNRSIFNTNETSPDYKLLNIQNASNPDQFNTALQKLFGEIRPLAATGGPLRKFATSNTTVVSGTIFGLVQCTPDLSEQQCSDCLVTLIGRIEQCCAGKIGVRVMAPSCYLRFETDRFFDDPADALASPPSPPPVTDKAPPPTSTTPPPPPPPVTDKAPPPESTTPPPGGKSNLVVIIALVVSVVLLSPS